MYSDLHWLLWDTLSLTFTLDSFIGSDKKKKHGVLFCDMAYCEQEQTVSAICVGLLNKKSDLPHKQGCKIQANQSIRGTKKI